MGRQFVRHPYLTGKRLPACGQPLARRTVDTATGGIFIGLGVRLALLR